MALMHYIEHFDSFTAADVGVLDAWTSYNVGGNHGIPASAIVEISCINSTSNVAYNIGLRNTASSGETDSFRRLFLDSAIIENTNTVIHTQLDSSGFLDCWVGHLGAGRLSFSILGYWQGGVYTDAFSLFNPVSPSGWEGYALDVHGVSAGQISEIVTSNDSATDSRIAGIRTSGSSIDRRFSLKDQKNNGEEQFSLLVYPSGSNAGIEIWSENIADVDFRLMGYFSTPPADYTEDNILFADPGSSDTWVELDTGVSGVPSSVLGQFLVQVDIVAWETRVGLRETDSTIDDRLLGLDKKNTGEFGPTSCTMHSNIDSDGKLEYYTSRTQNEAVYSLVGYWNNFQESPIPFGITDSITMLIEGLNPFIHYVETENTIFGTPSPNSWQEISILSSLSIPTSTEESPITLEILMTNDKTTLSHIAGIRSAGSSLDRKFSLNPALGFGLDALTMMVPLDSSGNIEIYSSTTSFVEFQVLGYWRGATYIEDKTEFQIDTEDSWVNLDLGSAYADQIVEIVISNDSTTIQQSGGIRSVGSSTDRYQSLSFGAEGRDYTSMQVNTSGVNGTIQVYVSNSGNIAFAVVGRWDTPPGKYTELMEVATVATSASVFHLKDVGIAEGNVAEIVIENRDFNTERNFGIRESGSTHTRLFWTLRDTGALSDGIASSMLRSSVNMVNGSSLEVYLNNTSTNHQFTKVGFWNSLNRIPLSSSGIATMFISGIPRSIATSGAQGGLYPSGVSMFIKGIQIGPPFDLFIEGIGFESTSTDMFMFGVNIFRTDTEFSISYPSGLSMFIEGSGISFASGQINLIINGVDSFASSGDMFINASTVESGSINLFLKVIEQQTETMTLYLHNFIDPSTNLIREQNAIFYLSRRNNLNNNLTTERIENIEWNIPGLLFGNKIFLDQAGQTNTEGDGTQPKYNDMGGSFASSNFGFALVGNVPDQQNILGHIISPNDYSYASSGSIMTAFWMSGAKTSGNIVDAGWFNRIGSFTSLGNSENDHTIGIRITDGNKIQVRTSVRDLPYDLPTATGLWWGGTTHYGTPTGSSWTWRTSNEYWAWNEEWPEVEIAHDDIAFFMIRSEFIESGIIPGVPSHMTVRLSVDGQPWVFIGSGATGPPASSVFSFTEPENQHAETAVGMMVQAVNSTFNQESLMVNEIALWSDADALDSVELSAFYGIVPTFFRPLDEYIPTIVPSSTYIRRTVGPFIFDPVVPGKEFFNAEVSHGLTVTLEVGIGAYGEDASAYLLEEAPPSGFVIRNIRPHADVTYLLQGTRPASQQSIFHDPQSGIMEPYNHESGVNSYGASIRWVNHDNHPQKDARRLPTPTGIYTYELFPVSYLDSPPIDNFTFDGSGLFFNGTTSKGVFSIETTGDASGTLDGVASGLISKSSILYISGPTINSGTISLYIRTQEKFTSSYIGVSERTPEVTDFIFAADGAANLELDGIEFGPHLFTKGPLFLDGTCPLFTIGPAARDKTLYLRGFDTFNTSGAFPSGLQMIEQGHITTSGSFNAFIVGPVLSSGTLSLYIQAGGVGRTTLYECGFNKFAGAISGFIKGPEFTITSGNFPYPLDETLFTFPSGGNSPDLYVKGPEFIITSGDFQYPGDSTLFLTPSGGFIRELFSRGHEPVNNSITLHIGPIPARQSWTFYLKTEKNTFNSDISLLIHGFVGASGVNQTFNNIKLYLEAKDANFPFTAGGTGDWTLFLRAQDDDMTTDEAWSLFLRADTTTIGVSPLYTFAHASGESPRGITINGSVDMICSVDPDDPNRIGYTPHDSDDDPWTLFLKVDPGLFNTANIYISGAVPVSFAASGNLFVRGLFEQQTRTSTLYIVGISGSLNNGPSGLHLFLNAGILVYNTSGNLYTHGY